MLTRVIALCGSKQSGKDTTANIITDLYPNTHRVAFADPIIDKVMHLYQLRSKAEYDLFKTQDHVLMGRKVSGRHLVREVGMIMRAYDENQFVNYVRGCICEKPYDTWVITDMRFQNEYDFVKGINGRVLKIVNPEVTDNDDHVSEAGFPDNQCDAIVYNNKSSHEHFKHSMTVLMKNYMSAWFSV